MGQHCQWQHWLGPTGLGPGPTGPGPTGPGPNVKLQVVTATPSLHPRTVAPLASLGIQVVALATTKLTNGVAATMPEGRELVASLVATLRDLVTPTLSLGTQYVAPVATNLTNGVSPSSTPSVELITPRMASLNDLVTTAAARGTHAIAAPSATLNNLVTTATTHCAEVVKPPVAVEDPTVFAPEATRQEPLPTAVAAKVTIGLRTTALGCHALDLRVPLLSTHASPPNAL